MPARTLPVLLQLVNVDADEPFMMDHVVAAFQAGVITGAEARHLQSFSKRSPKSRKRALADQRPVSDAEIDAMRGKLEAMSARLRMITARRANLTTQSTPPEAGPASPTGEP